MARRRIKIYDPTDRNSAGIEKVDTSFVCTSCRSRISTELIYIPRKLLGKTIPKLTNIGRCKFCSQQYQITYRTKKTRKGLYKLKVLEFAQCDARHRKHYRVLQQNGLCQGD